MSFTFTFETALTGGAAQGELSSAYSAALSQFVTQAADYLASTQAEALGIDAALALKSKLEAGEFTLHDLFLAAQTKSPLANPDANVIDDIAGNPNPYLIVDGQTIYLSSILSGTDTFTWDTFTKKEVINHTREFYTDGKVPSYDTNWSVANTNTAPQPVKLEPEPITEWDVKSNPTAEAQWISFDLRGGVEFDEDNDPINVVANSVTVSGTLDGDYKDLFMVEGNTLKINTNSEYFKLLFDGEKTELTVSYKITDGVNEPVASGGTITVLGTADQFTDTMKFTIEKLGDGEYTTSDSYELLGFGWSDGKVEVTGIGDYDFKNESFKVTGDALSEHTGTNEGGKDGSRNFENEFIEVNPEATLFVNWSENLKFDYTVSFSGPVDGFTTEEPDASNITIQLSYNYWM